MHSIGLKIEVCTKASLLRFYLVAMVSVKDKSNRALVTLLRNLAGLYGCTMWVAGGLQGGVVGLLTPEH